MLKNKFRRSFFSIITLTVIIIKFGGCTEEPPVIPDGNAQINITVLWDSTGNRTGLVKINNAKVILISDYGSVIKYTDQNGTLSIGNIPSATYSISVTSNLPDDNNIVLAGTLENLFLKSGSQSNDTIYVESHSNKGIVLNELYFDGPVNDNYYFWDQFIELYNSSDSVKYLDGCQIARMVGSGTSGPGADLDNDGDIDAVLHIFKFPGKPGEKNIPFKPKSYLVLALNAINHSKYVKNALDLSHADWEFYNQYSTDDIENPDVPNLINLQPDYSKDFTMPLDIGVIIITNGEDVNWKDGIDIKTVLDGAEYESSLSGSKTLDSRIDRGHFVSPAKYSGKSLQRRKPGLDSNNGLIDWEIIDHPTPGYQ